MLRWRSKLNPKRLRIRLLVPTIGLVLISSVGIGIFEEIAARQQAVMLAGKHYGCERGNGCFRARRRETASLFQP